MKLAITGCNGSVGKRVVLLALKRGHNVTGIDHSQPVHALEHDGFEFVCVDLRDYEATVECLRASRCDAVVQLAAYPNPMDYAVLAHNSNVVISWNILRGAAELGIKRIAQASSVNVFSGVYAQRAHFDYFPIDEAHPCLPDEPYGLSKLIAELQADTIVRRYPEMRIASLRLHWSVPDRSVPRSVWSAEQASKDLWGYVQEDSAADAFLLAIGAGAGGGSLKSMPMGGDEDSNSTSTQRPRARWQGPGHEVFLIAAPEIHSIEPDDDSKTLRETWWPDVPVREGNDVSGRRGFLDCSKAGEMLGWVHRDPFVED